MRFSNEAPPLPWHIPCVCNCTNEIEEVVISFEKKISELKDYIHKLHHGLHFIGKNEEEPIVCSRLDFM